MSDAISARDRERIRKVVRMGIAAITIAAACFAFNTSATMGPTWYGPYLSAATNVDWGEGLFIDLKGVKRFSRLDSDERETYQFRESANLQPYSYLEIGFVYFIAAAKHLFFWLPDVPALESFQTLLHVLLCVFVIAALRLPSEKLISLFLYALNPAVIYFVTYPFYYFYQVIPSFAALTLLLYPNFYSELHRIRHFLPYLVLSAVLAVVLMTRPTTIGVIATFFMLSFYLAKRKRMVVGGAAVFIVIFGTGYTPVTPGYWHTVYIGVGAYENPYMTGFSDHRGYERYEAETGVKLDASLGGNRYDNQTLADYQRVLREAYFQIAVDDGALLLRNAIVNVGLSFSVGYIVGAPDEVHYLLSLGGHPFLLLLLLSRQYLVVWLALVSSATFAPYVPPIPAYMYGSYILLVFGAIGMLRNFGLLRLPERYLAELNSRFVSPSAR